MLLTELAGFNEGEDVTQMLSTVPRTAELLEKWIALGLQVDQQACEERG
ncbi:hypothetical protein JM946_09505 [Steroidobacter sp. S1-65]|uniref:Uncharacterized protein n=1 Tax=Steroidobacter gossypii TaxID=2805490 RepID=A0ABS1WVI1_9GAMM|nr:hypothetical protein [Steroidobacter gossypii]MBM0104986.1 hypothetical protein [Steroidobacter gossypii]